MNKYTVQYALTVQYTRVQYYAPSYFSAAAISSWRREPWFSWPPPSVGPCEAAYNRSWDNAIAEWVSAKRSDRSDRCSCNRDIWSRRSRKNFFKIFLLTKFFSSMNYDIIFRHIFPVCCQPVGSPVPTCPDLTSTLSLTLPLLLTRVDWFAQMKDFQYGVFHSQFCFRPIELRWWRQSLKHNTNTQDARLMTNRAYVMTIGEVRPIQRCVIEW